MSKLRNKLYTINPVVIEMYESGKSQAEVAAAFGASVSAVSRVLKNAGVRCRKQRGRAGPNNSTVYKLEIIKRMLLLGHSWESVAAKTGGSRAGVYQLARKHGLAAPRGQS